MKWQRDIAEIMMGCRQKEVLKWVYERCFGLQWLPLSR
jgi:hypothetical protein